jgi:hypothetical protein
VSFGSIFHVSLEENPTVVSLSDANVAARSPCFNPDGTSLVWLESKVGGPHIGGTKLMCRAWPAPADTQTVIDISGFFFGFPSLFAMNMGIKTTSMLLDSTSTACRAVPGLMLVLSRLAGSFSQLRLEPHPSVR